MFEGLSLIEQERFPLNLYWNAHSGEGEGKWLGPKVFFFFWMLVYCATIKPNGIEKKHIPFFCSSDYILCPFIFLCVHFLTKYHFIPRSSIYLYFRLLSAGGLVKNML